MDRTLLFRVMFLVPMILSLSVHEFAHAYCAYKLGDDTAKQEGRLTLNPLSHIDIIGTILLPLLGIPFGWAKPVPINPARFRSSVSMRMGMVFTAAAGPLSNLAIALICTVFFGFLLRFAPHKVTEGSALFIFLNITILMNVALAIFNALPIPPLDGGRVADGLMPARLRVYWLKFTEVSGYVLLLVILSGQFGFHIIDYPSRWIHSMLNHIVHWIAG